MGNIMMHQWYPIVTHRIPNYIIPYSHYIYLYLSISHIQLYHSVSLCIPFLPEAVDLDGWTLEKSQLQLVEETEEDIKEAWDEKFEPFL